MGVYIKSMKMPENCRECPMQTLYTTGKTRCNLVGRLLAENYKPIPFESKPEWCPLVEVPELHGRLVDADVLWNALSKYIDNEGAKLPFGYDDTLIHRDSACFLIENAPTVIEQEE